jgi:hypothetical protein
MNIYIDVCVYMCICVYEFCGEDSWTQFPEKLPKNQCHREVNETQFSKKTITDAVKSIKLNSKEKCSAANPG